MPTKRKGLLLCSGGMSTTMIAKGLEKEMPDWKWDAMGVAGSSAYADILQDYDFVFVSPQIRFMAEDIKEMADEKGVKFDQILPQEYIVTKAPDLAKKVLKAVK